MVVGFILDVFWIPLPFVTQLSTPSKAFRFTMNSHVFTILRNMIFDNFPDVVRYQFGHCCLMICGIDFGSQLGPLWYPIPCFGVIVFDDCLNRLLIDLASNWDPKVRVRITCVQYFSHSSSAHLCPLLT